MRASQRSGCRTIVNNAKRDIDRIVNRLARQTGAEDISVFCTRTNGGFNCTISLSFGVPTFQEPPMTASKLRRRKR